MQKKIFPLVNKGMNRDLSISKVSDSSAYENHNIRILARDNDTMLSITNERGNKEITLSQSIAGSLIGWNVLNNHLILFSHDSDGGDCDHIYRVDYEDGASPEFSIDQLYAGNLNFSDENPIESVVYYESDSLQKIYWVDGRNVLRMMNFVADASERALWNQEIVGGEHKTTYFDSNREIDFSVGVEVSKDNSGGTRSNGVAQYFLTYYNKHGQETGFAWTSDLVYLSPSGIGGAADGYNNNRVYLKLSNLDSRYTNFRIYSVFRSSYDGTPVAYLVHDGIVSEGATAIDDAAHIVPVDAASLLFLGSQNVKPWTLAHKDQTLFIGDLQLDKQDYPAVREAIASYMRNGEGVCSHIEFIYSDSNDASGQINDIALDEADSLYAYDNQLDRSSSEILSFKGGEKYRFALVFKTKNGVETEAFWIGDAENPLYPVVDVNTGSVKRIVAKCTIPPQVFSILPNDFATVQLHMAQASYSDRSVKAQGILNPTVFNVWDRFNERRYSAPSWLTRVRNAEYANRHFDVVRRSDEPVGEIECNYWEKTTPVPYYILKDKRGSVVPTDDADDYDGASDYDYYMPLYGFQMSFGVGTRDLAVYCYSLRVKFTNKTSSAISRLNNLDLSSLGTDFWPDPVGLDVGNITSYTDTDDEFIIENIYCGIAHGEGTWQNATKNAWSISVDAFTKQDIPNEFLMNYDAFAKISGYLNSNNITDSVSYNSKFASYYDEGEEAMADAADYYPTGYVSSDRWWTNYMEYGGGIGAGHSAKFKKHLMFLDENVVTLDSPEITYERCSFDNTQGLKLRVVGMAKLKSNISDYDVDASHGLLPGENLVHEDFSGFEKDGRSRGLISWPLWKETGLVPKEDDSESDYSFPDDPKKRTPNDYTKIGTPALYWLHMFNRFGKIDGYNADEPDNYSELRSKIFANLKYFGGTIYHNSTSSSYEYDLKSLREFHYMSSQYLNFNIGDDNYTENKFYDGVIDDSLMPPGDFKYPILYSENALDPGDTPGSKSFLYSSDPVGLSYASRPHAVMSLNSHKDVDEADGTGSYVQEVLPYVYPSEASLYDNIPQSHTESGTFYSGGLIPWENSTGDIFSCVVIDDLPTFTLVSYNENTKRGTFTYNATSDAYTISMIWYVAKISFGTHKVYCPIKAYDANNVLNVYVVDISGYIYDNGLTVSDADVIVVAQNGVSGPTRTCDWKETTLSSSTFTHTGLVSIDFGFPTQASSPYYSYMDYGINSERFEIAPDPRAESLDLLGNGEKYVLIGEIFDDFSGGDTRYGGTSESAVENNVFIPCGPAYEIKNINSQTALYANQGDTYFQRWDDLRTIPFSATKTNGVIDIASVMLETHINIDGRTDLQRGLKDLASINTSAFGSMNNVYSQPNNFQSQRDLDQDFERSNYSSSVSWTLQKNDMAEVDEWMHITLASSLALDGDKGRCRAIRRYGNSLIAFQDRGIAEILYNSKTQLTTTDGVPVEIANSGKVDGKRYITNKYGCLNKWSIIEGKDALYFVDNINKMFAAITGEGVRNLSSSLGFSTFFRNVNDVNPWTPKDFNNIVSFYDRIHSDVYLTMNTDDDMSCLVYNEAVGSFTSFFDYGGVPMMTNIENRFVSFKNHHLWLQNEGLYCNFFGTQRDFWVTYRVTPDPYGDKIWTNLEYRADFYRTLDANGNLILADEQMGEYGNYQPGETFSKMLVWNEYQKTEELLIQKPFVDTYADVRKKFRIWRLDIPRAEISETNKYGFDRIRNPWINLRLKKVISASSDEKMDLMQLHDVNVIYFE